jgi:hypothetical protein
LQQESAARVEKCEQCGIDILPVDQYYLPNCRKCHMEIKFKTINLSIQKLRGENQNGK